MTSFPQSGGLPIRPSLPGVTTLPQNFCQPEPMQFRPVDPTQQSHQFIPPPQPPPPQFQPMQVMTSVGGMPPIHPPQFAAQSNQILPLQSYPGQMAYTQPNQIPQFPNNHMVNQGGAGMPLSSLFTYQPSSQAGLPPLTNSSQSDQKSVGTSVTSSQMAPQSSSGTSAINLSNVQPINTTQQSSDWLEHAAANGRRYYYNKKTKQSSWEKPAELMTPIERADASTEWKEFTSPDGRKYYYNKTTKQSKWTIPDELKIAREQAVKAGIQPAKLETLTQTSAPITTSSHPSSSETQAVGNSQSVSPSTSKKPSGESAIKASVGTTDASESASPSGKPSEAVEKMDAATLTECVTKSSDANLSFESAGNRVEMQTPRKVEEVKRGTILSENNPLEGKPISEETSIYANKQEAKNAFKALLESTSIGSDWTWEQAMRVIINDKRYGALKSLGERKQVFNEFLSERKKQEIEEKRMKQKKARENFIKMLEESQELTSSSKWRKVETMFENDERFNAIERARDREDLFDTYIGDIRKKEKAKAAEEHKRNVAEYRAFLETCDFIKANSQWRKVQDRLEVDERCSRLEKFDRLKIFQDYINDLEKEEEEKLKIQKEQLRKAERKNRDDFRKLMEEHVTSGILTAKSHWRDYYIEVKDLPSFLAVSSNTSGATPKDLFEDVIEELHKQYHEDKSQVKDAVKIGKISLRTSTEFESFKDDALQHDGLKSISEINLKLIYKELLQKLWDKEEKEAKKRQRLGDNFSNLLHSSKEISPSTTWEDCKTLLADCQQYSSSIEESFMKEIFEKYVEHLKESAAEKERKREEDKAKKEKEKEKGREKEKEREDREKRKERKEREREREHERRKRRSKKDDYSSENLVPSEDSIDEKIKGKEKDREHRRHHRSATDEVEKDGKERSKRSHRHNHDNKKSRKRSSESDSENHRRRQRKDNNGLRRDNSHSHDDLEDGELGDYGEVC